MVVASRQHRPQLEECLREQLGVDYLGCETSPHRAMSTAETLQPDVILLDMDFEGGGGDAVLAALRQRWPKKPAVIALSERGEDDAVYQANHLGANYYLVKPVPCDVLIRRIKQIAALVDGGSLNDTLREESVRRRAAHYLRLIGMPSHLKGYRYIVEAVAAVVMDHSLGGQVTKRLYPLIAERFQTTAVRVERSIRNAIEITWERGNLDQVNQLFSYVDEDRGKPTNSAFIAAMADIISMDLNG